jgi:CRP-like cAMP-binding protein
VVGYEVNKERRYSLQLSDGATIGAFELTFNQQSEFIYTALTDVEVFFIRRSAWHEILTESGSFAGPVIFRVCEGYLRQFKFTVGLMKTKYLNSLK